MYICVNGHESLIVKGIWCFWHCHCHTDEVWNDSTSGSAKLPWEINIIHKQILGSCQAFHFCFGQFCSRWICELLWQMAEKICVKTHTNLTFYSVEISFCLVMHSYVWFSGISALIWHRFYTCEIWASHWFDLFAAGYSVPHARPTKRIHVFHNDKRSLLQCHDGQVVILSVCWSPV